MRGGVGLWEDNACVLAMAASAGLFAQSAVEPGGRTPLEDCIAPMCL